MEWIERLNEAMAYIEAHIQDEICLEEAAKIALRYQYASPTAFNRAFRSVHGIAPSQVRKEHAAVKAYPPLCFQLNIAGKKELHYRIVKKEAFRVMGVLHELDHKLEKNYEIVPQYWQAAGSTGIIEELAAHMSQEEPSGLLGISLCGDTSVWKFCIGVISDEPLNGYDTLTIPKASWIVFDCAGTHASIQELERRIWTEWFPSTGYSYVNGPVMEVYLDPDPRQSRLEMWLMIKDEDNS